MKKFMALSMAAVMVLSMTGCGSKPAETATVDTTAATKVAADASATDTTAAESAAGTAALGKKYVINMDTMFAPPESENKGDETMGINLDILKAITQGQGFEYEVIPVGFSAVCIALKSGECDGVIAGMSITDERIQRYNFSGSYYDSDVGMAVLSDSDITTYNQLKGQNVAAKIGTEGCAFAESIADQYGSEVTQYESSFGMYQTVLNDKATTYLEDHPVIGCEVSRDLELTLPTDMEKGSSYSFTILRGVNPELVGMFSKELENIKANGEYGEILNTYIAK